MTRRNGGWTLVELTVAVSVLGALLAIAVPSYRSYDEQGREAHCANNRRTLEEAERACAVNNGGKPCLKMRKLVASGYLGSQPKCASGGTYVWIVTDADDPDYPTVGCSKHAFPAAPKQP